MSFVTTLPAVIMDDLPIVTFGSTVTCAPNQTSSSIKITPGEWPCSYMGLLIHYIYG
jgi:hypothetical protein